MANIVRFALKIIALKLLLVKCLVDVANLRLQRFIQSWLLRSAVSFSFIVHLQGIGGS